MSKSAQTRARLQDVAVRLFAERGFDSTTVAEIAAAAGVTPMTFFRHFASKEAVVLDDPYDPIIAELVAATDPELPPLERVRRGVGDAWASMSAVEDDVARVRLRVTAGEPNLRAKVRENNARTEGAIVGALVAQGTPRFEAVVAAAAVIGALAAALFAWAEDEGRGRLGDYITGALDVIAARAPVKRS